MSADNSRLVAMLEAAQASVRHGADGRSDALEGGASAGGAASSLRVGSPLSLFVSQTVPLSQAELGGSEGAAVLAKRTYVSVNDALAASDPSAGASVATREHFSKAGSPPVCAGCSLVGARNLR